MTLITTEVQSEFSVAADGKCTISIRGAARLLHIDESALRKAFASADLKPSALARRVMQQGFEVRTFCQSGIPDTAFSIVANYYAYKSKVANPQAEAVANAMAAVGVRTWIQAELGWKAPQPLHPPTQLKTVPEMFVMAGEALMLHQGQIQELQIKVQKIEANQERCIEEMATMPEANAATPILATRRAILKAVNLYSIAKGVEQRTAWNLLYEELRLRCGVAVKLRAKVSPQETYLDVAVRLGYGDQLYAIALDLFGLAREVV